MKRRQQVWLGNLIGGILLSGSFNVLAQLPDSYENDNTVSNAKSIDTNGTSQSHTIHSRTDEDWLKFTAKNGYGYQIKAEEAGSDLDIALELYDSENTRLEKSNVGFEGEDEQIDYLVPIEGSLYLKVKHDGFFGDQTSYSISVKESAPALVPAETNPKTLNTGETATFRFKLGFEEPLNKAIAEKSISFSLESPDNQASLSVNKDTTDKQGEVSTKITATEMAGTYTITATLVENDAISAKAEVEVIASIPDQVEELTVIEPAELLELDDDSGKAIFTEIYSETSITFKLADKNGNVINKIPEVNLINHQQADSPSQTLDGNYVVTEPDGKISITWNFDEIGRYTLKAGNDLEIATVYVMRTGVAFNTPTTQSPSTITTAFGGISNDNGQSYREWLELTTAEEVSLQGLIKVDDQHACNVKIVAQKLVLCQQKKGDIVVVSMLYLPFDSEDLFLFGRDKQGDFQFWTRYSQLTQNIDLLAVSQEQIYLDEIHEVDIYQGTFPFPGNLFMYFGYRLKDGTIVYNGQQFITVIITNANTTPE